MKNRTIFLLGVLLIICFLLADIAETKPKNPAMTKESYVKLIAYVQGVGHVPTDDKEKDWIMNVDLIDVHNQRMIAWTPRDYREEGSVAKLNDWLRKEMAISGGKKLAQITVWMYPLTEDNLEQSKCEKLSWDGWKRDEPSTQQYLLIKLKTGDKIMKFK